MGQFRVGQKALQEMSQMGQFRKQNEQFDV